MELESRLPPLPYTPGLGGPFAGSHNGVLVVAGGANFPDGPPWEGGQKIWHDDIYVLIDGDSGWRTGLNLERPLAYGASLSMEEGIVFLGGCDTEHCYPDVILVNWDFETESLIRESLPSLPQPSAFLTASSMGSVIYVAAGQSTVDPTSLTLSFWSLDLSLLEGERVWKSLETWPGRARIKAVSAVQSGGGEQQYFYLFSGEIPERDESGELQLGYLTDAYRFDPSVNPGDRAWKRLTDLPRPVAAGTASPYGQTHVLLFSGSTGRHVTKPVDQRPPFTREILAFHTITDTWVATGELAVGVVTTTAVPYEGGIVIPSGEIKPGVRTPEIQTIVMEGPELRFGIINYLVLLAYMGLLVWMGFYFSKREKSTNDYFLASRRVPWWAAGLSIYATQLSAITFIATPALIFSTNWLVVPAIWLILAMAPVVIVFYLPFYRRLNVTSAYEYLEKRFNLSVRLFGSASFIAFQLGRMAVVVFLPALALAAITGINIYVCILFMGVLSTLYTVLGGIEAVVWTDVLQTFVLLGGMILGLVIAVVDGGGIGPVFSTALAGGKLELTNWSLSPTELATWSILLGTFMLQFGPYTTDQAVIQRYLTTKDERAAAKGIWLNGIISIPFLLLFYMLGTSLYVFFKNHPELITVGMQNDQIFPLFVAQTLPPGVSGLVIAGVFAASMSSLDSSMHSIATAATTDFYHRFRPDASDRSCLKTARWITVAVGLLGTLTAMLLARYDIKSLFFFFQSLLGLLSSGLVGIFMLGIFTRRSNSIGVLTGAGVSLVLLFIVTQFTDIHFYLYAVIGISTAVITGYVVSLFSRAPTKDLSGLTYRTLRSPAEPVSDKRGGSA